MKLTDLDPRWVGAGGEGVYNTAPDGTLVPAPERHGVGVSFLCPCQACTAKRTGPPHDPRPNQQWQRTGDTFETLQIAPSIQRHRIGEDGCEWHGYVGMHTPGEVTTC